MFFWGGGFLEGCLNTGWRDGTDERGRRAVTPRILNTTFILYTGVNTLDFVMNVRIMCGCGSSMGVINGSTDAGSVPSDEMILINR